jgi:hypothetical protein
MPNYGYYLPLAANLFESVRFLDISPKIDGYGGDEKQKTDRDGTPLWVVTALVKFQGSKQETETFTLTASTKDADSIRGIPELTTIKLGGLSGGKWSKKETDKTSWSFQIAGISVAS